MIQSARAVTLFLILLVLLGSFPIWSQDQSQPDHDGMSMSMPMPTDGPTQAELLSWKLESERNHHLSGLFVFLAGIFILAQDGLKKKFPVVRYAWPTCFLLSGLFVLVYSDTELWPFGPKSWIQGTLSNPEVMQHKIFAVLLLAVGVVEMARARDRLKIMWSVWVFPVLAIAGSILLLFHSHNAGMRGTDHTTVMARIQAQHLSYAVTGLGIGVTESLAETRTRWHAFFAKVWPTLMMVLGVLLMMYTE